MRTPHAGLPGLTIFCVDVAVVEENKLAEDAAAKWGKIPLEELPVDEEDIFFEASKPTELAPTLLA